MKLLLVLCTFVFLTFARRKLLDRCKPPAKPYQATYTPSQRRYRNNENITFECEGFYEMAEPVTQVCQSGRFLPRTPVVCNPVCSFPGYHWTEFYNYNFPNDKGEIETRSKNNYRDLCSYPVSIDARVVETNKDFRTTREKVEISPSLGLRCLNKNNNNNCSDYKVRFCCDIDECTTKTHNCHENATCENTDGGFDCTCKPGFTGNGTHCEAVVPCKHNPCGIGAECSYESGKPMCRCPDDQTGDPHDFCIDYLCPLPGYNWTRFYDDDDPDGTGDHELRAQKRNPTVCSKPFDMGYQLVSTTNTIRFEKLEYSPSLGLICLNKDNNHCSDYKVRFCCDIDECATETHNCHRNATCFNTDGSFICICNFWFIGNGTHCEESDCPTPGYNWTRFYDDDDPDGTGDHELRAQKQNPTVCPKPIAIDAKVVGTDDGLASTSNNLKLSLDLGLICTNSADNSNNCSDYKVRFCCDINECADKTHYCHANAFCENTDGGFNCTCKSGFTGNGIECEAAQPCDPNPCDDSVECSYEWGKPVCRCPLDGKGTPDEICMDYLCPLSGYNWTRFYDDDDPDGLGDHEFRHDMRNPIVCLSPLAIDARVVGTSLRTTGEKVHSSPNVGLTCLNNENNNSCSDYKVRFCCDIDECDTETYECDTYATCHNTEGSYYCACKPGFTGDGIICDDIDECTTKTHNCHENATCENTDGGFDCTCKPGFIGDGIKCEAVVPCKHNPCGIGAECSYESGKPVCRCPAGQTGDPHDFCIDFSCPFPGYNWTRFYDDDDPDGTGDHELRAQKQNPTLCPKPTSMNYKVVGTDGSLPPETLFLSLELGLICTNTDNSNNCSDYEVRFCCDIDECAIKTDNCHANATCQNTEGSFNCTCKSGFTGNGTHCKEDKPCDPNPCSIGAECIYESGRHVCLCPLDDNVSPNDTCMDFLCPLPAYNWTRFYDDDQPDKFEDPDELGDHELRYEKRNPTVCLNPLAIDARIEGTIEDFRTTREKVAISPSLGLICLNNENNNGNNCSDYKVRFCCDINECATETNNCDANANCHNTEGSFFCTCKPGFTGDGITCDELHLLDYNPCGSGGTRIGSTGALECIYSNGSKYTDMFCSSPGYIWTRFYDDGDHDDTGDLEIRSLMRNPTVCSDPISIEVRVVGTNEFYQTTKEKVEISRSFDLRCFNNNNNNRCSDYEVRYCCDINECTAGTDNCHANATCKNTEGSFNCTCKYGFTGNGTHCEASECGDHAQRLRGKCHCYSRYIGDPYTGCRYKEVCEPPCGYGAVCVKVYGEYSCQCPPETEGNPLEGCTDLGPCVPSPCGIGAECYISEGIAICLCPLGSSGNPLDTCIVTDACHGGGHCGSEASCYTSLGTAVCRCPPGLTGDPLIDCKDIDECANGTHNCHVDATCHNTFGGFTCTCDDLFTGNGTQCVMTTQCRPCPRGANCGRSPGHECRCPTGMSSRKTGYCIDIDECTENTHNCHANATCQNIRRSFNCICNSGFTGNGTQCDPVRCDPPCAEGLECFDLGEYGNGKPYCDCPNGAFGTPETGCNGTGPCDPNPCGTGAVCTEDSEWSPCSCPPETTGNPYESCSDIDPCHPGACGIGAMCTNNRGSALCTCPMGTIGDPQNKCTAVGLCNPNPCAVGAECKVHLTYEVCFCPVDTWGDPYGTGCPVLPDP